MTHTELYHTDIPLKSWIQKILPNNLYPYAQLARWDRPIGIWLVLFPSFWGLALSHITTFSTYIIFFLGAILVRGAGCTINDLLDRKIDAKIERTKNRPLASGKIPPLKGLLFLTFQFLAAAYLLFQLPTTTIILGLSSLLLISTYPLMKRITHWPQFVLGLTMNWGLLMGITTGTQEFTLPIFLIYSGAILWTIGYDTIYAFQDYKDDLKMNVKSTTMLFTQNPKLYLTLLYMLSAFFFIIAFTLLDKQPLFLFLFLFIIIAHYIWQIKTLIVEDPKSCLTIFKSNKTLAFSIFIVLIIGELTHA